MVAERINGTRPPYGKVFDELEGITKSDWDRVTAMFTKPDLPVIEDYPYVDMEQKDSRYYTPAIDEWRVGFEYEQRREEWNPEYTGIDVVKYIWEPVIANLGSETGGLQQFMEGIDPKRRGKHYRFTNVPLEYGAYSNMVRVKYLDREDVESLGWKFNKEHDYNIFFIKDGYRLILSKENTTSIIIEIYLGEEGHRLGVLFNGILKNKSELKKLLTQLDIKWQNQVGIK